ncbi:MAG: hypothetical protein NZ954_09025 [Thermofilaceae archaeon]|nr:hypothetical protein [Thermofilaceae archaeon]
MAWTPPLSFQFFPSCCELEDFLASIPGRVLTPFNSFPVAVQKVRIFYEEGGELKSFQFFPSCCLGRELHVPAAAAYLSILSQLHLIAAQNYFRYPLKLSILSQLHRQLQLPFIRVQ